MMNSIKTNTMVGLLLPICISTVIACDSGDNDEQATEAEIRAMCEAKCSWMKGCKDTSDRTFSCDVSTCTTNDADVGISSAVFVRAMTTCYAGTPCQTAQQLDSKIPEFYCLAEAAKQVFVGRTKQQQQDCLAKRQECRDKQQPSFNDDWCEESFMMYTSSIHDKLEACWKGDCASIEACFEAVVPRD